MARILDRAQEIEHRTAPIDDGLGIDPRTLVQAAEEVGIDPNAVRDSLAIERLSIDAPHPARFDRVAGPRVLVVERELALTVPAAIDGIELWLTSTHRMLCDRRSETSLHARRRTDSSAHIGRMVTEVRGDGRLGAVGSVRVEAVAQITGSTPSQPRTLVRVSAERGAVRTRRLAGGGVAGVMGAAAGVGAVSVGAFAVAPLVSIPLLGGGVLLARTGRGHADRLELELQRLLSLVGRGVAPAGVLGTAASRVRRAVRAGAR